MRDLTPTRLPPLCMLAAVLAALAAPAVAPAAGDPKPRYALKEDEPRLGSTIRRDQLAGSPVALNLPYERLPQAEQRLVRSWWNDMPQGDEPPFPEGGLQALLDPMRKAQNILGEAGPVYAVALVDAKGDVVRARVLQAPSDKLADFTAKLLAMTRFKPARCGGSACAMEFPLEMDFAPERRSSPGIHSRALQP